MYRPIKRFLASHELERLAALASDRGSHWLLPTLINGAGAIVTFVVLCIIAVTKFVHGAWAVVVVIGLIVLMFRSINWHYRMVASQLALGKTPKPTHVGRHRVIIPVSGIHRGVLPALEYARSICGDTADGCVNAVYVEVNPQITPELKREWKTWGMGIPLTVVESPYRSITTPLLDYIREEARRQDEGMTTVLLPEFVPARWWQHLLHNQTSFPHQGQAPLQPPRHRHERAVPLAPLGARARA